MPSFVKNSFIYIFVELLIKGLGFFLLPIYTRYLSVSDYGILNIVLTISALVSQFLLLSLPAAITRYYFTFKKDPDKLKRFWGSIFTFLLLLSIVLNFIFLFWGKYIFSTVLGKVEYDPYLIVALVTLPLNNIFLLYQTILKTKELGSKYGIQNLYRFLLNISLILIFVTGFKMGVKGILVANLITGVVLFIYALYFIDKEVTWTINNEHIKNGLNYSLPLIPHSISGWFQGPINNLFVNKLRTMGDAGLYSLGLNLGSILNIFTAGFNEAIVPYFMKGLADSNENINKEIIGMSSFIFALFIILGNFISIFSYDIIHFMTTSAYHSAWVVTPFIVVSNILMALYRLLVMPLYFNLKGPKYISFGSMFSAVVNIGFLFLFIPLFGYLGAGISYLAANLISTLVIGIIAHKIEPFEWIYSKFILLFFAGLFSCSAALMLQLYVNSDFLLLYKALCYLSTSLIIIKFSETDYFNINNGITFIKNYYKRTYGKSKKA